MQDEHAPAPAKPVSTEPFVEHFDPTVTGDKALAQMGFKRANNDQVWDWLRDAHRNLMSFLASPAVILPFLKDKTLQERIIANGDSVTVTKNVKSLTVDVAEYVGRAKTIYAKHSARRGSSTNDDDLMYAIGLSQEYLGYVDEFQRVVMPQLFEVLEIYEKAGLDTTQIRADTDAGAVYRVFEENPTQH